MSHDSHEHLINTKVSFMILVPSVSAHFLAKEPILDQHIIQIRKVVKHFEAFFHGVDNRFTFGIETRIDECS